MTNIFNISKKLHECSTYITQLERKNRLLQERISLDRAQGDSEARSRYEQRKQAYLMPIREMATYVSATYAFRHNVLTGGYEFRRRQGGDGWQPIDERQLNTILSSVQDEGDVFCLKSLVVQRIKSVMADDYHPVAAYLEQVRGTWDGRDRAADIAARISHDEYCRRMVHLWLRAMVAQWMGADQQHANAVMLMLVSPRQGLHKSTFLRELLPPELRDYYTDDFSLSSRGNAERKLVAFAMVNIDEFDKLPRRRMPDLKTLMQTLRPSFTRAYKGVFNQLPRIASFVGTSNTRALLTDRTGSRRFLILEPQDVIDVEHIDHRQLYAQLVSEVEAGEPHHFSKADEQLMEKANEKYYVPSELEQLLLNFFRPPRQDDDDSLVLRLSAKEIMTQLTPHNRRLMRTVSITALGTTMSRLGMPREHCHDGNRYLVVAK